MLDPSDDEPGNGGYQESGRDEQDYYVRRGPVVGSRNLTIIDGESLVRSE